MIISVLERRQEIGLHLALGATRGHIRIQFLSEAIRLALVGGVAGVIAGAVSTTVYAHVKGWSTVIPVEAWAGGLVAAILIGALAGLLPAIRAARLSPTQALWCCGRPIAGIWPPVCLMPDGGFSRRIISR
jgi:putative ABC transport system permease protein